MADVMSGNNLTNNPDLSAQTASNYLSAARGVLQLVLHRSINIYDPSSLARQPRYHPFLGQQLAERRKWSKPMEKKEPFTADMFQWLASQLALEAGSLVSFVGCRFCVFDWMRLGIFTGFRVSEYGQSKLKPGQRFQLIPHSRDVPTRFRGAPLAFVAEDFVFYDGRQHVIPHSSLFEAHCRGEVHLLEITWRYDKSAHNFAKRRFYRTHHPIFDPVDAGVSIIRRALYLRVLPMEPIGVWSGNLASNSSNSVPYRFLRDREVASVMRAACIGAYPDPSHYMRQHILQIVPHSNRVTAAVCLKNGGAQNDDIAFKLRWHPTSVPTYLRDFFQQVGCMMEQSIQGALSMSHSVHAVFLPPFFSA
eukprot:scaffold2093_cov88-Cylindrotheca_fusiformis.AAC.1